VLAFAAVFAFTRVEPLRFSFLALFAIFPFMNILVPPGRLNFTVFDVATVVLTLGLLLHKAFVPSREAPLFPAPSLGLIWLLLLPCVLFARYPLEAAEALVLMFTAYVFFWFVVQELRRPQGMERLAGLLSVTAVIIALGLFIDHFLHINLSLRGGNLNQQTMSNGQEIYRAGGFFQDPQRAGAFLAALLTFLMVLMIRGRCRTRGLRLLVWAALLTAVPALFLTVSRAALLVFLAVSALTLVATNRWPAALKLAGLTVLALVVTSLLVTPEPWMAVMPAALAERLAETHDGLVIRAEIWMDTWEMFSGQPLTGIGFGGFQQFLLDTRPGVVNYYGIGEGTDANYVPDQPESGYFMILYEGGLLGVAAFVLLAGATLSRAVAALVRRSTDPDGRTEVIAALAGLAALAGTFITLFTTSDPRLLALFLFLIAVIWRQSASSKPAAPR
jgi:O-antigen ligase